MHSAFPARTPHQAGRPHRAATRLHDHPNGLVPAAPFGVLPEPVPC